MVIVWFLIMFEKKKKIEKTTWKREGCFLKKEWELKIFLKIILKKKKNAQNFFLWFFFAPSAPEAPKSKVQSPIVIYIRHIEWFISCITSSSGRGSIQASSVQKARSLGRCASGADANYVHSLNWFLLKKTKLKREATFALKGHNFSFNNCYTVQYLGG